MPVITGVVPVVYVQAVAPVGHAEQESVVVVTPPLVEAVPDTL